MNRKDLTHVESKIVVIMNHHSHYGRYSLPEASKYVKELSYRMNKAEKEIKDILSSLEKKGIISIMDSKITLKKF